jgi:phosphoribosyl-ATP pyrophosphohydrolase
MIEKIKEFNKAYGLPIGTVSGFNDERQLSPEDGKTIFLRRKLIQEEFKELMTAPYLDEVMKEACDLVYVVLGMFVEFGWDFDEAFSRVHESNMSKLGEDGKPVYREDGKVLKGPNYKQADLSDLL